VAVRRAADRLEATAARSGYRCRRLLGHSPAVERLVPDAVARAGEGDDDALRLLYLLYADNLYGFVLAIVRDEHALQHRARRRLRRDLTAQDWAPASLAA
jgi:RNA polymerase sigma-70 factor (ECF subfamily)